MAFLLLGLTLALAFANGANDVSKGVATLVGTGLAPERRAILWGTAWTVAGVGAASFVSHGLVAMFSGAGFLTAPEPGLALPAAVLVAAIGWLVIATRAGLPVSTTHALVGGIVGAGVAAGGVAGVHWAGVAGGVAAPLLLSPLLSLALISASLPAVRASFRRLNRYCLCIERGELALAPAGLLAVVPAGLPLYLRAGADCPPQVIGRVNALDSLHWLSAGLTSFARGLNDAPKILALGLTAGAAVGIGSGQLLAFLALAMGTGSWLAGRKVTGTLAHRVTALSGAEGMTANMVTSALVALASTVAAPVSTTHVSAGAIMGVGMHRRSVQWRLARDIAVAWLVTVPVAAILSGVTYALLAR